MFDIQEQDIDLVKTGALVAVRLWVPEVKPGVVPIETMAEINTGLAQTFIQEGVATSLKLEPVGKVTIRTSAALEMEVYLFRLRIVFPADNLVFSVTAVEVPYIHQGGRVKCLIGRDILRYTVLTYNGTENKFALEFKGEAPSAG